MLLAATGSACLVFSFSQFPVRHLSDGPGIDFAIYNVTKLTKLRGNRNSNFKMTKTELFLLKDASQAALLQVAAAAESRTQMSSPSVGRTLPAGKSSPWSKMPSTMSFLPSPVQTKMHARAGKE